MMDDFLEQAEPRTIASLLIIVVFLLCTIQVLYLLWPQFKQFRELSNSYSLLQQASNNEMGLDQQLQLTTEEVKKLSYQLHGDMSELPDNQMESYIIGRLQKVSWASGVELVSVVPGRGKQVQMFQETLFDVQINATYFDFFNWLKTINQDLGYIVVKKFEIQSQGSQIESDPKLNISLTLVSYRIVRNV